MKALVGEFAASSKDSKKGCPTNQVSNYLEILIAYLYAGYDS